MCPVCLPENNHQRFCREVAHRIFEGSNLQKPRNEPRILSLQKQGEIKMSDKLTGLLVLSRT